MFDDERVFYRPMIVYELCESSIFQLVYALFENLQARKTARIRIISRIYYYTCSSADNQRAAPACKAAYSI